jgi:hypothetical protein
MTTMIEFVFMLTHHDRTVDDALRVYEQTRGSGLRYIGLKDVGATPEMLAELTRTAQADGLEVMLEVVSTSAEDELRSLRAAAEIGVDWVLGGTHAEEGVAILRGSRVKYCPFPGRVIGHPSELDGELDEIAEHARSLTALDGVHGLDLLAYRHRRLDPVALTQAVVAASAGPVIVAGAIASPPQIRDAAAAGAWGFTIGGAVFEDRLPGAPGIPGQLAEVLAVSSATAPANKVSGVR